MEREYRNRQPSFFFPIALITTGIVWLLVNNGTIAIENVYRLIVFWPVLLILAGASLLFRRIWWPVNALVWTGAAVLVLWLLTSGSGFLPQGTTLELKHETLSEPVEQAKSASVRLDLSIYSATIQELDDSSNLIEADVYSTSGMLLDASGGERKNIQLRSNFQPGNFVFNPRIDQWIESASQRWEIGLTSRIPLELRVDVGTGSADLNLEALKLESLRVEGGTGSMKIALPAGQDNLPVHIDVGTGSASVTIPANTPVELNIEGGTGSENITLPSNAGVRVEVRSGGVGSLNLPAGFTKVRGDPDEDEGVWENEAFSGSKTPVKIILDIGTGSVNIR